MNAFELLKADHKKVAELFDRLESARGAAKLDVFKEIKRELDLHAHVEEKFLYPALEKSQETHDLTLEAYQEHKVVKTLLAELAGSKTADDEWQAKAKVLRENVEHHVDEEEGELFDKADDVLSDEQVEAIGNQMEAEKARQQGQPAPKRAAPKSSKSKQANAEKPGILARLADFVGLGGGTPKKTTSGKKPASKTKSKKSGAKKTTAGKAAKAATKTSYKSKAGKPAKAAKSKRSGSSKGSKKAAARSSAASKKSGAGKSKSTARKRSRR